MTLAELHREIARLIEENEALTQRNKALEAEKAELRARPTASEKEWLTPKEAAAFIGRSPAFLDQDRIKEKPRIPFTKEGYRTVRYHRTDLVQFNEERKAWKRAGGQG